MKRTGVLVLILLASVAGGGSAASAVLEVKARLAGVVLAEGIVHVGVQVTDGQPLLYVQTTTQAKAVAARAPRDGTVRDVLVQPGERVERGQVIVLLGLLAGGHERKPPKPTH